VSPGEDAAEHRGTCRVNLIVVEYSCPDVLDPLAEVYPGPASHPRKGNRRRLEWYGKWLSLNAKAPVTGEDVNALGREIGEAVALEMFRGAGENPPTCPATMLLGRR
jgi:hypothetical protein